MTDDRDRFGQAEPGDWGHRHPEQQQQWEEDGETRRLAEDLERQWQQEDALRESLRKAQEEDVELQRIAERREQEEKEKAETKKSRRRVKNRGNPLFLMRPLYALRLRIAAKRARRNMPGK